MTIILFLVDTSSSMNQRSYLGTSLIDIAKASVETFMKIRSRAPDCRWDRYMLLTFEDPPANIKAGWKESHATFVNELKNLQAQGLTMMGPALKHAFDLLNVNRMQSGIDTYGQGRCPFYLEPAVIMVITDGGRLTTSAGVQPEINLPMNSVVPGSELTKEPFRWDQRIFGLVLRLPGNIPVDNLPNTFIPASEHPLDAMCEVTGGRSYEVYTQKMLNAAIDSLVQKVQSGVVISFEKMGPDPPPIVQETNIIDNNGNTKENQDINKPIKMETDEEKKAIQQQVANSPIAGWQSCRKLIFVPRSAQKGYSVGHWPIPESYWPDINCASLPPRSAQPVVRFYCTPCEPMVIENLPFDKYELEPSPLTQYILERREPNKCWQVFISGSAKYSDTGHPFGYLKASSGLTCVNLFMMPYNYPVLLPLLDCLCKGRTPMSNESPAARHVTGEQPTIGRWMLLWSPKCNKFKAQMKNDELNKMQKPTPQWRQKFDAYLKTMPAYYAGPLRRALARMGAPMLVPDNMDNSLSYSVITYLKKLKNQAKIEMDRLIASVGQKVPLHEGIKVDSRTKTSILQRRDFNQLMQNFGGNLQSLKQELTDFNTFTVGVADRDIKPQYFRNPYDVPRKSLLDQIARMRTNFLQKNLHRTKLVDDDQLHSIPVQQMGNYQDYLKNKPAPLKELESTPARVHTFGNPFKVKMNMVDEADDIGQQHSKKRQSTEMMPSSPGPKRRKPGPLPKDFVFSRSPTPSPPASPAPSEPDAISINESWNNKMEEEEDQPLIIAENEPEEEKVSNHVGENNVNNKTDRTSPQTVIVNNVNSLESVRQKGLNNTKKDNYVWTHNTRLRHSVFKELKKPGRNYENLFNQLNTVQGTLETRCAFIKDIICEAQRFKKKVLTQMLEQFEKSMVQSERQRKNSIVSGYHSSR